MLLDLIGLGILAWVTIRVASEEAWGSAIVSLSVLFAGLFAMNTFEPLAEWLGIHVSGAPHWQFRWDLIAFLGLFSGAVFAFRNMTDRLAPGRMPVPWPLEIALRWLAGLATGGLMVAIVFTSLHLAPLPRVVTADDIHEPLGFEAEQTMFFGMAPDRRWLEFNQWLSLHGLSRDNTKRVFDGPHYHAAGDYGYWPSLPIRYADRREKMTRSRRQ